MSYEKLKTRCLRRLGRSSSYSGFDEAFLDEMQAAQEFLEKGPILPSWLKFSRDYTLGQNLVLQTPPDLLRLTDDGELSYLWEGKLKFVERIDSYELFISKVNAGLFNGKVLYYLFNETAAVLSTNAPMTLYTWDYYKQDTVLTGSNTNEWCAREPELILGLAGTHIAMSLRNQEAMQYFQALYQTARQRMISDKFADEFSGQELVMGDPE